MLGVAYKQDIDDYRESPALRVIEELKEEGANVEYFDPYIPSYREKGVVREGIREINPETISSYDLVVITAAHTKNVMKDIRDRDNIEVL